MDRDDPSAADDAIQVPELRDYHKINAAVVRRLDAGADRVRLAGVDGRRLLLAGLSGPWRAVIELDGDAGPELAFGLDAPDVVVVCRGRSADGAGAEARSGTLLLLGPSGTAVGRRMTGGSIVAADSVGPRAGLGMSCGDLVLLGPVGPAAGDRQAGGRLLLASAAIVPHLGRESVGGRRFQGEPDDPDALAALKAARALLARFAREGG